MRQMLSTIFQILSFKVDKSGVPKYTVQVYNIINDNAHEIIHINH